MTAIVLNTYSYIRTGIIVKPFNWFAGFMSSIGQAIMMSRQISANEQIARVLLIEYPEHTYYSLLTELNRKTLEGYKKNA
jgi:hypothetical protein